MDEKTEIENKIKRLSKSIFSIVQTMGHSNDGETEYTIAQDYRDLEHFDLGMELRKVGFNRFLDFVQTHMGRELIPMERGGQMWYFVGDSSKTKHLQKLIDRTKPKPGKSATRFGGVVPGLDNNANRRSGGRRGGRGRYQRGGYSNYGSRYSDLPGMGVNGGLFGCASTSAAGEPASNLINTNMPPPHHIDVNSLASNYLFHPAPYPFPLSDISNPPPFMPTVNPNVAGPGDATLQSLFPSNFGYTPAMSSTPDYSPFLGYAGAGSSVVAGNVPSFNQPGTEANLLHRMFPTNQPYANHSPISRARQSTYSAMSTAPAAEATAFPVYSNVYNPLAEHFPADVGTGYYDVGASISKIASQNRSRTQTPELNVHVTRNQSISDGSPSDEEDDLKPTDAEWAALELPMLDERSALVPIEERSRILLICNRNPQGLSPQEVSYQHQAIFGRGLAAKREYRMSCKALLSCLPELRYDSTADKVFPMKQPALRSHGRKSKQSQIPRIEDVQREIIAVLEEVVERGQQQRIRLATLAEQYQFIYDKPLDTKKYGYAGLQPMLRSMSNRIRVSGDWIYLLNDDENSSAGQNVALKDGNAQEHQQHKVQPKVEPFTSNVDFEHQERRPKVNAFPLSRLVSSQVNMNNRTHDGANARQTPDTSNTLILQEHVSANLMKENNIENPVDQFKRQAVQLVNEVGSQGIPSYLFEDFYQNRFGSNIPFVKLSCTGFVDACCKHLADCVRLDHHDNLSFILRPLITSSSISMQINNSVETVENALQRIHTLFEHNYANGYIMDDIPDLLSKLKLPSLPPSLQLIQNLFDAIINRKDLFDVENRDGYYFVKPISSLSNQDISNAIPPWVIRLLEESDQLRILLKLFDPTKPPQCPSGWPTNAVPPGYILPFINIVAPHRPEEVELLTEGTIKLVRIQDVSSPYEFYLTCADVDEDDDDDDLPLDILMDRMQTFYSKPDINQEYTTSVEWIQVGMMVAATYDADDDYQRAMIIGSKQDAVSLLYVDYGTKADNVSFDRLRWLHHDFMHLVAQAVCAQLKDVAPLSNINANCMSLVWTEEACIFFDERVENLELYAHFKKYDPDTGVFEIFLIDTNDEDNEENMVDLLVDKGFAVSFKAIDSNSNDEVDDEFVVHNDQVVDPIRTTSDFIDLENELMSDSDDVEITDDHITHASDNLVQEVTFDLNNLNVGRIVASEYASTVNDILPVVTNDGSTDVNLRDQLLHLYETNAITVEDIQSGYTQLRDRRQIKIMVISSLNGDELTDAVEEQVLTEGKLQAMVSVMKQLNITVPPAQSSAANPAVEGGPSSGSSIVDIIDPDDHLDLTIPAAPEWYNPDRRVTATAASISKRPTNLTVEKWVADQVAHQVAHNATATSPKKNERSQSSYLASSPPLVLQRAHSPEPIAAGDPIDGVIVTSQVAGTSIPNVNTTTSQLALHSPVPIPPDQMLTQFQIQHMAAMQQQVQPRLPYGAPMMYPGMGGPYQSAFLVTPVVYPNPQYSNVLQQTQQQTLMYPPVMMNPTNVMPNYNVNNNIFMNNFYNPR